MSLIVLVEFTNDQRTIAIKCKRNQKMRDICRKYSMKEQIKKEKLYFIYQNVKVNEELTFEELAINNDKNNGKMSILVEKRDLEQENEVFEKSKDIICPDCGELAFLKIKDNKLIFLECQNHHKNENILINEYEEKQKIDQSRVKCSYCISNKIDSKNKKFFLCFTCNKNLCPRCQIDHCKDHYIIDYDDKNYKCKEHKNQNFCYYCKNCQQNLCFDCKINHDKKKHEIEELRHIQKKDLIQKSDEINNCINKYNEDLNLITEKFQKTKNHFKFLFKLNKDYLDFYNEDNRNYITLHNLNEIYNNNTICEEINTIINDNIILNKINRILNLSDNKNIDDEFNINSLKDSITKNKELIRNNISEENNNNGIIIINYKIIKENQKYINIFDSNFVKNNKNNNLFVIYNEEEFEIREKLDISNLNINSSFLKIKLKGINNIIDASYMFCDCPIFSFSVISKWNTIKVTNMERMFYGCEYLETLPDISNWNTINVNNMSYMFYNCNQLQSLPDISNWKLNNIKNISNMFYNCSSLKRLPDISKWTMENLQYMNNLFYNCSSLTSEEFPDISNWNTEKVENMGYIFYGCSSLKNLPDISKWKTKKVNNMRFMFNGCSSLKMLPDISKWNINNVTDLSGMFSGCNSLKELPDISKWKINKAISMNGMFQNCNSLKDIPDISKWEIKNVNYISDLFNGCNSLEDIHKIDKKWNFRKVKKMSNLFQMCTSIVNYESLKKWNKDLVNRKKKEKNI